MTGSVNALMVDVQRRLETLYALPAGAPVSDFLIPEDAAARYPGDGSRTLLAETGNEVSLGVVLDRDTSRALAESDPRLRLHGENLGPFCTLAEEVSHFLYLLFCAESARHVTELELELQGEVDKYLSAVFLLSLQNEGAVSPRLRELLLDAPGALTGASRKRRSAYRKYGIDASDRSAAVAKATWKPKREISQPVAIEPVPMPVSNAARIPPNAAPRRSAATFCTM
jgi:hypothetical protein